MTPTSHTAITVAVVSLPGAGHVNPTLPVIERLLANGDRVVYYAPEPVRAQVTTAGVEFRALPEPPHPATPPQGENAMRAQLIKMAQTAPELAADLARLRPDVVVYDSLSLVGALAARAAGLPTVALTTTFAFGDSVPSPGHDHTHLRASLRGLLLPHSRDLEAQAAAELAPVLADLQISGPLPDPLALTGDATIVLTSESLQPQASSFGPRHHFVGADSGSRHENTGDLPEGELRSPVIYVSFGTHFNPLPGLLDAAAEGLHDLAGTLLISTGRGPELGATAANVLARPSWPQLAVLQHAAVTVSHGGMNSTHEALQAGVPMVIVPHGADQPLVAHQVAAAGAGIAISPHRASARTLRRAVAQVLANPAYAARARELGAGLRSAGGAERAAAVIHQTARPRAAQPQSIATAVR